MTAPTFRQFINHVLKRAGNLFDKHGQLSPMYHCVTASGRDVVFPAPPGDKDRSIGLARAMLADLEAVRVAMIDEAWVLETPSTNDLDLDRIGRDGVEAQPGRIEVILVSAEDAQEGNVTAWREIIRHGGRAVLGPIKIIGGDQAEGRMIGLLPRTGTVQ